MDGTADEVRHDAADSGWTNLLEEGDSNTFRDMMGDEAVAIAARQGWVFDKASDDFGVLCFDLVRAKVLSNRLRMERERGHPAPTPSTPDVMPTGASDSRRSSASSGASFVEIALAEKERPTFSGGASTKQSLRTALRYFGEAFGDLSPKAIGRRHASELADLLALSPLKRALPRQQRQGPIRQLVEAFAGKEVERLSCAGMIVEGADLGGRWQITIEMQKSRHSVVPDPEDCGDFSDHQMAIVRGSFQVCASRLVYQATQANAGESEIRRGRTGAGEGEHQADQADPQVVVVDTKGRQKSRAFLGNPAPSEQISTKEPRAPAEFACQLGRRESVSERCSRTAEVSPSFYWPHLPGRSAKP